MPTKYTGCNIEGEKLGAPHDMTGSILPNGWKLLPEKPEFTGCNIIYYEVPAGAIIKDCNIFPKGTPEQQIK